MKLIALKTPKSRKDAALLDQMYRLRSRVFADRLAWKVSRSNGRERDQFDEFEPTYILALSDGDVVIGCARLLPAIGPTMLQQVFPQLLSAGRLDADPSMIESSRFCVDTARSRGAGEGGLSDVTFGMFAGILEWCLHQGYREIATATDVRFERILRRAGWPMQRLGQPIIINETLSVAGILPVSWENFERVRPHAYRSAFGPRRHAA
ncbi:acyl-homoserine-lactone synthase [Rhizobium ruizarguesonis]|uniref:acyl-homoserine-lactone synthase n=1 Tax=Rhizobium ruizarguesonis TaxID=2081791 RepID=UPI001031ED28|nr:acyl-homoserine-lactone synthase TraI [Rhizobium ruizarguesonis]TCA30140.1 GNAT family N-acetyltransferase [Rhizobium leguminosarum bv. viciae]TBC88987.1 GNAT family N-acetyltransferase [Rhizobium ruizarguesonis]TBD07970.1 GNAT family N-acetyltransferase [Rhizobium ruizarguesonis]TBD25197.1 GNAT family N-acetyltransferase [Rhizobium ruizarguesonis]TBD32320.1 GNAT family N-acetyltransferase [Rhizobium ruizarguesonis]